MKNKMLILLTILMLDFSLSNCLGDINQDDSIDVVDVVNVVNHILQTDILNNDGEGQQLFYVNPTLIGDTLDIYGYYYYYPEIIDSVKVIIND